MSANVTGLALGGGTMKKAIFLAATAVLAAVVVWLVIVLPTDRQLIATDSTHDNIQSLSADSTKLDGGRRLQFAAYDPDCCMVQLCFSVKKGDRALKQGGDLSIAVNGTEEETWSYFTHSTWKQDYCNIFLADVESGAQITFTYDGKVITIE